jgi:Anti-sigma-K factor rskA, C-terminal
MIDHDPSEVGRVSGVPDDPEVPEDLAAYALDALDPEACLRLEAHLGEGGDPRLTRLLAEYRGVAGLLPHAVVPQAPPPASWDGVLARVRGARGALGSAGGAPARPSRLPSRRRWWDSLRGDVRRRLSPMRWPALAAACAALLLWNVQLQRQLFDPATVPGGPGGSAVGAQQLSRLSLGPIVPLEGTGQPGASARLFVDREGRGTWLAVAGLAPLPDDRVYQLWFARPGQPTVSGAAFRVDAEGGAVTPVVVPGPLGEVSAVAVTEEPAPGSLRPTGRHLLDGRP